MRCECDGDATRSAQSGVGSLSLEGQCEKNLYLSSAIEINCLGCIHAHRRDTDRAAAELCLL